MSPRLKLVTPAVTPGGWMPWVGGRKRTVDGVTTYYLRRRLGDGVRREFALGTDERKALAELSRFDDDPAGYVPPRERAAKHVTERAAEGSVCLDEPTLKTFFAYADERLAAGKLSANYVEHVLKHYLKLWAKALKGRDLHTVTLDDLQRVLDGFETARPKRIIALKAFTAWARTEKRSPKLRRASDPTIDLKTPKGERRRDASKGYPMKVVERLYRDLDDQTARDMVRLRVCAHGMHDSELARLAEGDAELERISDSSGIEGVLKFWQAKAEMWHRVPVDAATFAAAERLRARGNTIIRTTLRVMINRVVLDWHGCKGVKKVWRGTTAKGAEWTKEVINPCPKCVRIHPREFRHSFATWAMKQGEEVFAKDQRGVSLEKVSRAMGHLKLDTTAGHYVGDHVPPMYRVPALKLQHPFDPKVRR